MKAITGFFKKTAKKSSKLFSFGSLRGRRALNAYESQDYEAMVKTLADMTATQFINEVKFNDEAGLLHKCAVDDNIDAMAALTALPYLSEVVDSPNESGWSPLHCACIISNRTHLDLIKLLVDNGASLTK